MAKLSKAYTGTRAIKQLMVLPICMQNSLDKIILSDYSIIE